MQKKAKYELAWYFDNESMSWQYFNFKELKNESNRAKARSKILFDEKDGKILLGVRNHEITPHFFRKKNIREKIKKWDSISEKHREIIEILLNKYLNSNLKIKFGYYEKPWDKDDKGFDEIIKVTDFLWKSEVGFGLTYGKYIIFDILGRSKSDVALLDSVPYIAIEVIDTHFHNFETFDTLLELTKNLPFIVNYYFVSVYPTLNQPLHAERSNGYTTIRIHMYLFDGSFWIRNMRIEDEEEFNLDIKDKKQYYEYVSHRIYDLGLIKNKPSCFFNSADSRPIQLLIARRNTWIGIKS